MFKIGDRVAHKETAVRGTVVDVDGNTVYIELNNGSEHDYDASMLMLEEEMFAAIEAERDAAFSAREATNVSSNIDFGPYIPRRGDHRLAIKCLDMINSIDATFSVFAQHLIKEAGKMEEFNNAKPLNKVMMMSDVLNTPTIVWMGAAEMNDDGLMRQVIVRTILNMTQEWLLFKVKMELGK